MVRCAKLFFVIAEKTETRCKNALEYVSAHLNFADRALKIGKTGCSNSVTWLKAIYIAETGLTLFSSG